MSTAAVERIVVLPLKIRVAETAEGCWEPLGLNTNSTGYVSLGSQSLHRLSFESHHGPLLPGEVVRHTCDNTVCFNPDHLLRGSRKDNSRDMIKRGRGGTQVLTEDDVRAIRAWWPTRKRGEVKQWSERYGITRNALRHAAVGITFEWVN